MSGGLEGGEDPYQHRAKIPHLFHRNIHSKLVVHEVLQFFGCVIRYRGWKIIHTHIYAGSIPTLWQVPATLPALHIAPHKDTTQTVVSYAVWKSV